MASSARSSVPAPRRHPANANSHRGRNRHIAAIFRISKGRSAANPPPHAPPPPLEFLSGGASPSAMLHLPSPNVLLSRPVEPTAPCASAATGGLVRRSTAAGVGHHFFFGTVTRVPSNRVAAFRGGGTGGASPGG